MPVKYWSFAGLLLTYGCNAACASCYLGCSPDRQEEMSPDDALAFWRELIEASPRGCRIHLSGGEPFLDWPRLLEVCRRAQAEGLGPLHKVETNAFWADDAGVVRDRLRALDAAGMQKLVLSTDPYHQQFVPIERCRLAARIAEELLGRERLQVRWRDWLAEGCDTDAMDEDRRAALFVQYAAAGRDRWNGRAAMHLAPRLSRKLPAEFADDLCREPLLRSRHVHVDPAGRIMPGTCAGIVLGSAGSQPIVRIWRQLDRDHASRPVVGRLAAAGPFGLLRDAAQAGFRPRAAYAGKCHLCWDVRRWLVRQGLHPGELGPAWLYGPL
jgi:hypothetical protein